MCLSDVRLKLACLRINLYYELLDSIQCTSYFYNLLYPMLLQSIMAILNDIVVRYISNFRCIQDLVY